MVIRRNSKLQYVLADSQKVGNGIHKACKGFSTYNPLSEDAYRELHYDKPRRGDSSLPGDVYGPPRFFRYGEGGRSKKKSNSCGFAQKDEEMIVDDQFRSRNKR